MPHSSSSPTQSSTSSQMPSASASAAQSPPHTPKRRARFRRSRSPFWDVRTSALVDGARTVADAALVEFAHAVVHVVTDAIGIGVRCAVTSTHAQGVELVSVAVAVSFGMSEHPHS